MEQATSPTDRAETTEMPTHRSRLIPWLMSAVVAGVVLRIVIAACSVGTNDATAWARFGRLIRSEGLMKSYSLDPKLNHPPLPALWSALAWSVSRSDMAFSLLFKLPPIAADLGVCLLLLRIGRQRAGPVHGALRGWALAAGYAWHPLAILVSGYHCNTDSIYVFFALLALHLADRGRLFWAGVALGAGINVKLIPVLLVPSLLALCRDRRQVLLALAGLALMALPFLPPLLLAGDSFRGNVVAYVPQADRWGFYYFLYEAERRPELHDAAVAVRGVYQSFSRFLVLGSSLLVALWALRRRRSRPHPAPVNAYELATLTFALFLIFTPGFGVQYTAAIVPMLLLVHIGRSIVYGVLAGLMLIFQYGVTLTGEWPLVSWFPIDVMTLPAALFGLLAWWTLLEVTWSLTVRRR